MIASDAVFVFWLLLLIFTEMRMMMSQKQELPLHYTEKLRLQLHSLDVAYRTLDIHLLMDTSELLQVINTSG